MKGLFYEFLIFMSRLFGTWFVALFAWIVSSGFFLFRPRVTRANNSFYRSVFPEKNARAVLGIVWDQFHHFATVFVDRVRLDMGKEYECEVVGMEAFQVQREQGLGGIFLMSHFGNWEIAARLFARQGIPLMLHLGVKQDEQIEKKQKHDLARDGVRVAAASAGAGGSPFDLLESIRVLRKGGFVSIAGDRIQREEQRQVEAAFFGHAERLPVAPHLLAQKAGVPIFPLFIIRVKSMHYRVLLSEPWFVPRTGEGDREEPLRTSAARYLAQLEEMVRNHPEHWYRFEVE
jgi:lauroyl/myristoyl acyltransferase